jgi:hypothetical protein
MIYGRGTATYTLLDDKTIHLRFQSPDGTEQQYSGPAPASLDDPVVAARMRMIHHVRAILGFIQVGGGCVGAITLWHIGHTTGAHVGAAVLGALLGLFMTSLLSSLFIAPVVSKRYAARLAAAIKAVDSPSGGTVPR